MRKIYFIAIFVVLLLISFLGITYSYEYKEDSSLKFELIGDYELNLSLNDDYVEYGIRVVYNGDDISSTVDIDSSMVDMNNVGEYKVKYSVKIDGVYEYVYRIVRVTENISPEIILKGDQVIYVSLNTNYVEPGYTVLDNYDINLNDKIVITSNLNVAKLGEYQIEYRVSDSSGNETKVIRKVIVR